VAVRGEKPWPSVGTFRGRPWGIVVSVPGEFRWPPVGSSRWPLTITPHRSHPVRATRVSTWTWSISSATSTTPRTFISGKPTNSSHMRVGSDSTGALQSEGVEHRQSGRAPATRQGCLHPAQIRRAGLPLSEHSSDAGYHGLGSGPSPILCSNLTCHASAGSIPRVWPIVTTRCLSPDRDRKGVSADAGWPISSNGRVE
jgi:hypothetical protein